ncbi:MAG: LytTR family DNA-binding domain-containing protein [Bacteroidota bacterium]
MASASTPQTARLRAVAVDDEPPARRKLARWLADDAEIDVVAICADGYEALDALDLHRVDLLVLDIQMPELSGFDVLRRLPPGPAPVVVFATAYDAYAIQAFEHHAAGYLLKPYDRARFDATIAQAKAQHRGRIAVAGAAAEAHATLTTLLDAVRPPSTYLDHLAVRRADRVDLVRVADVDWIEASGNYVTVHARGQRHLIRASLTRVASRLDPRRFLRIHRSTVVHLDRVASLVPASHGDYTVVLRDGTTLSMSRTYREHLRGVLEVGF